MIRENVDIDMDVINDNGSDTFDLLIISKYPEVRRFLFVKPNLCVNFYIFMYETLSRLLITIYNVDFSVSLMLIHKIEASYEIVAIPV